MKIMLSGGVKTENILAAIGKKFASTGDQFIIEKFMDTVNSVFQRGEYYDKALITDQSITKEFTIKDEAEIRRRVNNFAIECSKRPRKALYVFLVQSELMANIVHEEILPIINFSAVVYKQPPYSVAFFNMLITEDVKQLPADIVYKPAPVVGEVDEVDDFDDVEDEDNVVINEGPDDFGANLFVNTDDADEFDDSDFEDDDDAEFGDESDFENTVVEDNHNIEGFDDDDDNFDSDFDDNSEFDSDFDDTTFEDDNTAFEYDDVALDDDNVTLEDDGTTLEDDGVAFENDDTPFEDEDVALEDDGAAFEDDGAAFEDDGAAFEDDGAAFEDDGAAFDDNEDSGGAVNESTDFDEQGFNDTGDAEQFDENYNDETFDNGDNIDYSNTVDTGDYDTNEFNGSSDTASSYEYDDTEQGVNDDYVDTSGAYEDSVVGHIEGFDDDDTDMEDQSVNYDDASMENDGTYSGDIGVSEENNIGEVQGMDNNNGYIPGFDDDDYDTDVVNDNQGYDDFSDEFNNQQAQNIRDSSVMNDSYDVSNMGFDDSDYGYDQGNADANMQQGQDPGYQDAFNPADYEQANMAANAAAAGAMAAALGGTGPVQPPVNVGGQKKGKGLGILNKIGKKRKPEAQAVNMGVNNTQQQQMMQQQQMQQQMLGGTQQVQQQQMQNSGATVGYNKKMIDPNKVRNNLRPFAARGNAIVVTGFGGCGTSTVAYNLANIVNQLGYTALLIDCDVKGRTQNYISRVNYESMDTDGANLMSAVNSSTGLNNQVSILKSGFHLLTMGIGADIGSVDKLLHRDKLNRFINNCKASHEFVIYDIPFEDATNFFSEVTYAADNIVCVTDMSTWGITKMMLGICNVPSEDMQDALFNRAQIVFNKERGNGIQKLFGQRVTSVTQLMQTVDKQVYDLIGDDPGFYFDHLTVSGIIKDDPAIENCWFENVQYSDTKRGQGIFLELLNSIVLRGKA